MTGVQTCALPICIHTVMYVNLQSEFKTKFWEVFKKPMVWNDEKDELLCRKNFALNVFCVTKRSIVSAREA